MNGKLKIALLALLGFSTACSTLKESPKAKERPKSDRATVIVMYGARPPLGWETKQETKTDSTATTLSPSQPVDTSKKEQ
ncbi:MAG: hypothetical protein RRY23_08585 [Alistipes sp.]